MNKIHYLDDLTGLNGSNIVAISYQVSLGSLASGWLPGETLGTGILLPQDFCGKTMQTVMGQPIKKFKSFSTSPESLLAPTC